MMCASHRTAWPAQSDQVLLPPHHPGKINGQSYCQFFQWVGFEKIYRKPQFLPVRSGEYTGFSWVFLQISPSPKSGK